MISVAAKGPAIDLHFCGVCDMSMVKVASDVGRPLEERVHWLLRGLAGPLL